jgi:hypothetical protein
MWMDTDKFIEIQSELLYPRVMINGEHLALVSMLRHFENKTDRSPCYSSVTLSGYLNGEEPLRRFRYDYNTGVVQEYIFKEKENL